LPPLGEEVFGGSGELENIESNIESLETKLSSIAELLPEANWMLVWSEEASIATPQFRHNDGTPIEFFSPFKTWQGAPQFGQGPLIVLKNCQALKATYAPTGSRRARRKSEFVTAKNIDPSGEIKNTVSPTIVATPRRIWSMSF